MHRKKQNEYFHYKLVPIEFWDVAKWLIVVISIEITVLIW